MRKGRESMCAMRIRRHRFGHREGICRGGGSRLNHIVRCLSVIVRLFTNSQGCGKPVLEQNDCPLGRLVWKPCRLHGRVESL